jgi:hypothetical protein
VSIDEKLASTLRALVASQDGVFCERCKCCEMTWQSCLTCQGDGYFGEDYDYDYDYDDDEDAAFPRVCDICDGERGWYLCECDEQGRHASRAIQDDPPKEGT